MSALVDVFDLDIELTDVAALDSVFSPDRAAGGSGHSLTSPVGLG